MGCVCFSLIKPPLYIPTLCPLSVLAIKMAKREKVESWKWDFLRTRSHQQNDSLLPPFSSAFVLYTFGCVLYILWRFLSRSHIPLWLTPTLSGWWWVTVCVKKRVVYRESGKELKSDIGKETKCFVMRHALQTGSARADEQEGQRTICKAIDQHIASSSRNQRDEKAIASSEYTSLKDAGRVFISKEVVWWLSLAP